jgi:hypothetical protein
MMMMIIIIIIISGGSSSSDPGAYTKMPDRFCLPWYTQVPLARPHL